MYLLVNVYIYFAYSIRTSRTNQFNILNSVKQKVINERQEPINDFKENFSQTEYLAVNICQYIKIIFSDLVIIVATLLVYFSLFLFVKKQVKKKKYTYSAQNKHNNNHSYRLTDFKSK